MKPSTSSSGLRRHANTGRYCPQAARAAIASSLPDRTGDNTITLAQSYQRYGPRDACVQTNVRYLPPDSSKPDKEGNGCHERVWETRSFPLWSGEISDLDGGQRCNDTSGRIRRSAPPRQALPTPAPSRDRYRPPDRHDVKPAGTRCLQKRLARLFRGDERLKRSSKPAIARPAENLRLGLVCAGPRAALAAQLTRLPASAAVRRPILVLSMLRPLSVAR